MNGTHLNDLKLRTVACVAQYFFFAPSVQLEEKLASQMLAEGIRKLHDSAVSFRGKGKYLGHAHWSRAALEDLRKNGGSERGITARLAHEHVIPVGVVLNKLLTSNQTDLNELESLIRRFSVVAIITREEEALLSNAGLRSKMPKDWDGEDIWARYKAVKLYELIESAPV